MSESLGASEPPSQTRRNSLVVLVLGLSWAKAMTLPDETMKLPSKETRRGALIHGGLRFLSLAGFIMALQSLLVLNGWSAGS
ncbi:hypothetical protein [Glutamicibacter arilaitensis]|uniref:hypothetical protein n=1 Tax=Glutamicibacter arilaitensis TaxID=256701 RepID=UPI00384E3042